MKKTIIVSAIILAMLSSVMAGTLASYVVSLDSVASGSTVAKEFIFLEDGQDTFQDNVNIAPTETVIWQFAVKNYDSRAISEVDLYYALTFDIYALPGSNAIDPLVVTVKDKNGSIVGMNKGVGQMEITGVFPLSPEGQSAAYTVEIYWPKDSDVDNAYIDFNYGTGIKVSATASQLPVGTLNPGNGGDTGTAPTNKTFVNSVNKSTAAPEDILNYTLYPQNTGSQLLSNARLREQIPAGASYVTGSISGGGTASDDNGDGAVDSVSWSFGSNTAGTTGTGTILTQGVSETTEIQEWGVTDIYIDKDFPSLSFDGNKLITTAKKNETTNSLVRFELSDIPSNAVIDSADLGMTVYASRSNHTDSVYKMVTSWTESASWNDSNGSSSGDWANGSFSSSDYASGSLGTISPSSAGLKTLSIKNTVQSWVTSPSSNKGLVLITTGSDSGDVRYYDSEEFFYPSRSPKLTVTWHVPGTSAAIGTSRMQASQSLVRSGDNITVSLTLNNTSGSNITNVVPSISSTGASVTKVSGPAASYVTVPASGSLTLSWTYRAESAASPGSVVFRATATNGTASWSESTSNSVLICPSMGFQVKIKAGTVNPIYSTATFYDDNVYPQGKDTNRVVTKIGTAS
ncbi:MAG: DNRLRE domain-containing protein [Bacillota bacterium]|nr:DNRLRE domain-containing protein [Bacillota bacterium]